MKIKKRNSNQLEKIASTQFYSMAGRDAFNTLQSRGDARKDISYIKDTYAHSFAQSQAAKKSEKNS